MRESYLETRDHWPAVEVPKDLFSYYVAEQLFEFPEDEIHIYTRQSFLDHLDTDLCFRLFWEYVRRKYPAKSEYFASLTDEQMPYKPRWIKQAFYRGRYAGEFNEMTAEERRKLKSEFEVIRPAAYQAALNGEAIRLNCSASEVRPLSLVLPLEPNGNEESKLADLPDALFLNIVSRLDTLDVFRVTLVCKRWKNMVFNNPGDLKRAEHAKTTHLLTFTEWMDPSRILSCKMFKKNYQRFSLGLIGWCYGITEHLETVILDQALSYNDVAALIQSCPNLKNLQIGCDEPLECLDDDAPFNSDVVLPKLEFYCSRMHNFDYGMELDMKVLLSCESLFYFGASLVVLQEPEIEIKDRMKHMFGSLVALDLPRYSYFVLEILAEIDQLQLRYLGLGELSPDYPFNDESIETARLRDLLARILPKLKKLEILKVNGVPGIGSSTIKLLTELKLSLKFGVFIESVAHMRILHLDNPNERDYWKAQVLTDFGQMLLSNDPGLDLSEFYFIVTEDEIPQDLREMNFGFTFISVEDSYEMEGCDVGLHFQSIKRRLGIDF